jgi:SDR family mycofactocin-dependent oxidoreductase
MTAIDDRPVVVVTGGARGIGRATGSRLAAAGWRVALIDAPGAGELEGVLGYPLAGPDDLATAVAAVAAAVETTSVESDEVVAGFVADVRDGAALDQALADVVSRFGRVDAAVAAAGAIAGGAEAWHTDAAVWDAMIGVNLTGVFHLARAAVPHLLARPEPRTGRFVAVASAASVDGLPRLAAYTAAKAGVAGLVRALAAELGPLGVTANAVAPGSTRTAMLDASAAVYGLDSVDEFAVHQPIGRLLDPAEIAAAIAWLCSPEASAVTGVVLPVDGGMTAT